MQQYDNINEQERFLEQHINDLNYVNKQLSELNVLKEDLVDRIIGALEHDHEGQKSYNFNTWKIEVKTPFVYSLNKKLYESGKIQLDDRFNPIKKATTYTVDKRLCDECLEYAPKEVRDVLVELIDKKPGKAGVTIKERV